MRNFAEEIRAFRDEKAAEAREASQLAAFRIATGIDLAEALQAGRAERLAVVDRLKRLIERERLKGANRHWSYDLNRHIALKQALDRLASVADHAGQAREPAIQQWQQKKETAPKGAA